jgi:hypothetical protein
LKEPFREAPSGLIEYFIGMGWYRRNSRGWNGSIYRTKRSHTIH